MFRKHMFFLLALCLVWPTVKAWSALPAPAQQPPAKQKQPKDREEYDLFNNIIKEADPARKLQLLDQWTQKYPDTAFKEERLKFYMQTHQQAGQAAKAVEAAGEVLALAPDDFGSNYVIASLTPFLGSQNPKVWDNGEKAGNALLKGLEQQFAPDKKPANVTDADWANGKKAAQIEAHQVLGWVAMAQKKNDVAEQEFLKTLELNPNAAQVSLWLGQVVLAQKNPDKNALALFSFARAAAYDGQGALSEAGRKKLDDYLTKVYNSFHGQDERGLAALKELAKKSALPPPDLKIKSKAELELEKEEELAKSNPLLATWLRIKEGLAGSEGAKFWETMKGHSMPKLRGTVISAKPALKPKTLELALSQSTQTEITLTLEEPLARKLDAGTVIEFEGAEPTDYSATPFMIKMQGGKIVSGLPEAPKPVRKAPPAKAKPGAAKKKAG